MKKSLNTVLISTLLFSVTLYASEKLDLNYYKNITIDSHYDDEDFTFMQKFMKENPQKDVKVIENPTFTCKDAGFTEKEMYQDLVLYGVKTKDGKVIQSEEKKEGSFKAEHAKKYFKKTSNGEATCVEIVRYKGSEHYGTKNYAILRGKR